MILDMNCCFLSNPSGVTLNLIHRKQERQHQYCYTEDHEYWFINARTMSPLWSYCMAYFFWFTRERNVQCLSFAVAHAKENDEANSRTRNTSFQ